jgi:hypothetical protein
MKTFFKKISGYFKINPTAVRTAETSQNQDGLQDINTRSPEREAFDKKTYKSAKKKLRGI